MVNSSEFRPSTKLKALKAIEHVKSFLVLTMIALALTVIPLSPPVSAQPLNSWSSTTSYPTGIASTGIASQSCATNSGFIYCVGGTSPSPTSAVYFAPITSSGVGPWTLSAFPYGAPAVPTGVPTSEHSCVTDSGFIYCVGGGTNLVFFAPITSSGVGPWTLSAFPYGAPAVPTGVPIERESCVTNSGFIYCVGGFDGSMVVSDVFFAPISSSGVGPWTSTTSYPIFISEQSCVTNSGFIYCVGGNPSLPTSAVYFAPISSSGVGTWTPTTSYPFSITEQSCVARASFVFCVGGLSFPIGPTIDVFFAPISSSGVGTWTSTNSYPFTIFEQSCVTRASLIYCVGGNPPILPTSAVFFG